MRHKCILHHAEFSHDEWLILYSSKFHHIRLPSVMVDLAKQYRLLIKYLA